ncbi:DNA-directed RNA polymerase subunit E'' [Candidatus Woesearchaeota archaeon]|nr:DNA-directed RNA polymerase subunit E'' [Candidatus Woesearchaeota archaeon]
MKKVCKKDRIFVEGAVCPLCHNSTFTETWKGRITILDAEKSDIAKKVGIDVKGEYAIKVR